jgi:hypothetical protein
MLIHDFSDRAKECLRLAQRATSAHDQDLFMAMARAWYGLTEEPGGAPTKPKLH